MLFYTHVSDRFAPFHSKVIAADAGEASHVIDGLLDHESGTAIHEHATDPAGAVDHVFGLATCSASASHRASATLASAASTP